MLVKTLQYDVKTKKLIKCEIEMDMPDSSLADREIRTSEIRLRLSEIDADSIRPLRAVVDGSATEFDRQKLSELETEARELREELRTLG